MSPLQVLINRIKKLIAERESAPPDATRPKDKWREDGFDKGLEWTLQEAESLLADEKIS